MLSVVLEIFAHLRVGYISTPDISSAVFKASTILVFLSLIRKKELIESRNLSSVVKLNFVRRITHMGMRQVTYFLSSGCTYTKDMDTNRLTNLKSNQVSIMNGDDITASGLNNESVSLLITARAISKENSQA